MSRPLLAAEAARARQTAETQRAAEIAERCPGWTARAAREGNARGATRAGNPKAIDDGIWAATRRSKRCANRPCGGMFHFRAKGKGNERR